MSHEIILVNPSPAFLQFASLQERRSLTPSPPLGILYLAAVLEEAGFSVVFYDLALEPESIERILDKARESEVPFLGITANTPAYNNAVDVSKKVKEVNPKSIIVLGGPHVSFKAEETLQNPSVDIVARFEGEETIVELAQFFLQNKGNLESIHGISYRLDNSIHSTPDRPFIEDLDSLPFPARHLALPGSYEHLGVLITGRGCSYRCTFCAAGNLWGHRYRVRSPENVRDEIVYSEEHHKIHAFHFVDDTFTIYPERSKAICKYLEELEVTWSCQARVNTITPALLEEFAEAGCYRIQYGVESGSDKILCSIHKGITVLQIREAVIKTLEKDINVRCSLLIGHPQDTIETVEQTIELGRELTQLGAECVYALSTPLPGTDLWNRAEELGVRILTHDYDYYDFMSIIMETKTLNKHQLSSF
ncbi:MAG: cobalamin B12-binding domain-containing protein, partial [Theionarchaea archaeon]|nr:cobalamin B12-binding domain-containing protein [Theionarchaea archaeon]